jgi:hypothetical protein
MGTKIRSFQIKGSLYVVIISFTRKMRAQFVFPYEKGYITNILNSADFVKTEEFFGERA